MAFHIRDKETDALVRELARRKQIGLTEAVRVAVREELNRAGNAAPLRDRLKAIAEEVSAYPSTGKKVDKAFFDDLSGN